MIREVVAMALLASWLIVVTAAFATPAKHDGHEGHGGHDAHAAHRAALSSGNYRVSTRQYRVPDVALLDASGDAVALREFLDSNEPVALNFIFTTCTTICPVMTVTFSQMQQVLGADAERLRLVSITIDPEYDRPEVLDQYARQFNAGDNWTFLTGDTNEVVSVLRSFDSYTGSKMSHRPVTLLKNPGSNEWTRIDGLANGESLAKEVSARLLN